jgi:hypothetical protein
MTQTLRRVAVLGGVRIPFCRSNTLYADLTNLDMMTAVLNGLADKFRLKGEHIDEVVGGAVVTHSRDFNLTREAVVGSKLAPSTPGITLMQACGTSLQAAMGIAAKIACGEIESGIAVGSDTTSDPPIVFGKKFASRLNQATQQKTTLDRLKASGNSLFVVEHELDVICHADWIVDVGPAAGEHGGRVLYSGPPDGLRAVHESQTRRYLFAEAEPLRRTRRPSLVVSTVMPARCIVRMTDPSVSARAPRSVTSPPAMPAAMA